MNSIQDSSLADFFRELSSKEPIPGGGGASALIGTISAALCSMVASLTTGKKKYAEYQADIEEILSHASTSMSTLLKLIEKDAEVFEPLVKAYSISKDDPNREEILEAALVAASLVPMEILKEIANVIDLVEQLSKKGTKLALSDVGVAASACRSAMESAIMNIYINTKLMKNHDYAARLNAEAEAVVKDGTDRCNAVYRKITDELRAKQ